jgi:hypothetical protein
MATPETATAGRRRERLMTRLERLKTQHSWGDLTDAQYQDQRDDARAELALLPDLDLIRAFDSFRVRILALPDAIAAASPARIEEMCRMVVKKVVVANRQLKAIDWTPAARPFFEKQRVCPQGDSNP